MKIQEINKDRERINNLRKEGKITMLTVAKQLDILNRLEAKLKK